MNDRIHPVITPEGMAELKTKWEAAFTGAAKSVATITAALAEFDTETPDERRYRRWPGLYVRFARARKNRRTDA